jgi:hypothetical protein
MINTRTAFLLLLLATTSAAQAEISISPLSETQKKRALNAVLNSQEHQADYHSVRVEDRTAAQKQLDTYANAGNFREQLPPQRDRALPSQAQLQKTIQQGQEILIDRYGRLEPNPSWISEGIMDNPECSLAVRSASGFEKVSGGLNGVTSLFDCEGASVVTYEFDYRDETRQKVTVFDDEYATAPQTHAYRVQQSVSRWADGDVIYLGWINPKFEIRAELYCPDGTTCPSAAVAETIRTTARYLVPDPSAINLKE